MTCHQARQQLAAYRRDDWTAAEMRLLADHLATCAECRQVEAMYRRVGESLRMLPTITPAASFRESVFAAIAADQRKMGPAATRVSRAETEPALPVVRAPITPMRARPAQRPVARAALAIAAMLALALFATQFIPSLDTGGFAASFFRGASSAALSSHVTYYSADARFSKVTTLRATGRWLAFTATDGSGASMLFVTDRQSGQRRVVLASASPTAVRILGLSSSWLVWSDATNGWTVHATALVGASAWQTRDLAQGDGAGSLVTGAWTDDTTALISVAPSQGAGALLSVPLAGGAGSVVAQATHAGGLIMRPASMGGVTYWNEVWTDGVGALHGVLWRSASTGIAQVTQAGDQAYGLAATNGRILWVRAGQAPTAASADAAALAQAARQAQGVVESASVTGAAHQVDQRAIADTLQAAGSLAVWSDGAHAHVWNLNQNASDNAAGLLSAVSVASVNSGTLAWFDGARVGVYNA